MANKKGGMSYTMCVAKNIHYCLEDVHFTSNMEAMVKAEWGGEVVFSSLASNSRGVAIFISNNLDYKIHDKKSDDGGNWVALDISINEIRMTLVSLYGPNDDKPGFFHIILGMIEEINNVHCILCGDWNLIQDPQIDSTNYIHINNKNARKAVLEMKEYVNLVDPWRLQNTTLRSHTWGQPTPLKQSRLDFFLISEELTTFLSS